MAVTVAVMARNGTSEELSQQQSLATEDECKPQLGWECKLSWGILCFLREAGSRKSLETLCIYLNLRTFQPFRTLI